MIVINDKDIQKIVKEEVDKTVRKRIKEMQGDYTSKGYLEFLIHDVLWDTILEKVPTIEEYLQNKIDEIASFYKNECKEIKKSEITNKIIDALIS